MKKIFFLIILFSWLKSEAQIKIYGPDFRLARSHRVGVFGISTTDSVWYADSLRVKAFKPLRAGVYTTATAPPASAFPGYIIVNSDSTNKPQYSDGTNWVNLPGTGGGGGGSGTVTSVGLALGTSGTDVNVSGSPVTTSGDITLNIPDASGTARGLMTTGTQTIAGVKTFTGSSTIFGATGANASLSLRRTSDGAEVGNVGVVTNPRLNTLSGTWLFSSSGSTIGVYNSTGFFFGGGSTPANAYVGILAGTTSLSVMQWNSGPLKTSKCVGCWGFLTDKIYFTITTGTAEKEVSLNDNALTSGRVVTTTTNGRLTDLAPASNGDVLTLSSGAPVWSTPTTLTASTYTPTFTLGTNVDGVTAPGTTLYYQRIGNQVTVWGNVSVDATAASTTTNFFMDLPVVSAMTGLYHLSGQMNSWSAGGGQGGAEADVTNDRANFSFQNGTATGAITYTIRLSYEVL